MTTEIKPGASATTIDPVEMLYQQMQQESTSSSGAILVVNTARNMLFHAEVANRHADPTYKPRTSVDLLDLEGISKPEYAMGYAEELRTELNKMMRQTGTNLPFQAQKIINTLGPIYDHEAPTPVRNY